MYYMILAALTFVMQTGLIAEDTENPEIEGNIESMERDYEAPEDK